MKINVFSVATILVCLTFAIVWADTPPESSATDATANTGRGRGMSRRRQLRQRMRCFFACKRPNSPSRANCNCDSIEDCQSKPCGQGEECKMIKGVFRVCLKDKAVCDLQKSGVDCDATTRSFYYNKDTKKCERFSQGKCAGNLNVFERRGQCYMTCKATDRSVCELPKATTPCDSTTPGYFFNKDTKRCEQFSSGECSSNTNMFSDMHQCRRTCRARRGPFRQRPRPGFLRRRP